MGDRANIVIEADQGMFPAPVFFYTHWSGYWIKPDLQRALVKGRDRWNDSQYLARVIFCEMIGTDQGITGYGITTKIGDGGAPLLVVNMEKQEVRELTSASDLTASTAQKWSFEDFVAAKFEEEE